MLTPRTEQQIFDELLALCRSPGYIHALSILSFRDNFIRFKDQVQTEDMAHLFSQSRLIRTEVTTLVGLLIKGPIDVVNPGWQTLSGYITRTEALLAELHSSMSGVMIAGMLNETSQPQSPPQPDHSGAAMREPIFYGGESAYGFQYRDFAELKYGADDAWLQANRGFTIGAARKVVAAAAVVQDRKIRLTARAVRSMPAGSWTILPGFMLSAAEVAESTGLPTKTVERVLDAFTVGSGDYNKGFTSLGDYNAVSGTPLLRGNNDDYIMLQQYGLFEALYESPFFWLGADKQYEATALSNRGRFTEQFAFERLTKVFGAGHVVANVDIWKSKAEKIGEIDVLVLFADRAIVLQAKSKRLTLEARKGNDLQIKDDFRKAIQDFADQAHACAMALLEPNPHLTDSHGNAIKLPHPLKRISPVCIVADHYPALSFQARQFLRTTAADKLAATLVTDVFALDAMTEMLASPLRLLSYLDLRSKFGDKFISTHELTLLSYHLKQNLWLSAEYDFAMLSDDIATDLDIAMSARREGLPGARTPDGILTRTKSTEIGRIISQIEALQDPSTIDLGLLLLELSQETVETLSKGIRQITARTRSDGKRHDFSAGLGTASAGLTVYCNPATAHHALEALQVQCDVRKYSQKAERWFGLALQPNGSLLLGMKLDFPWKADAQLEKLLRRWPATTARPPSAIGSKGVEKIGRNALCPCGSGKKYKKCHGAAA